MSLNRTPPTAAEIRNMLNMYEHGLGCKQIAKTTGYSSHTVLRWLRRKGVEVRSKKEAARLYAPTRAVQMRGRKHVPRTPEWTAKIRASRRASAKGTTQKPRGHIEYTMGPNAQRSVHVVMMEERIGRRLQKDECVHHLDGDPSNNDWNNLALLTISAHTRLHRLMDKWQGVERSRNSSGQYSKGAAS